MRRSPSAHPADAHVWSGRLVGMCSRGARGQEGSDALPSWRRADSLSLRPSIVPQVATILTPIDHIPSQISSVLSPGSDVPVKVAAIAADIALVLPQVAPILAHVAARGVVTRREPGGGRVASELFGDLRFGSNVVSYALSIDVFRDLGRCGAAGDRARHRSCNCTNPQSIHSASLG